MLMLSLSSGVLFAQKAKDTATAHKHVLATYSCPMHPDVVSDKAGKCSKCGMALTQSKKEQMKMEVKCILVPCILTKQVVKQRTALFVE